ncbi:MAG: sensor histidine kinase [Planctomycetia bacterium]
MVRAVRSRSLTRRLVLPVVGLVLTAVLANVGFAAWLAARRSAESARATGQRIAETLRSSRISAAPGVLDALHRLTGSHFVVWDEATRRLGPGTLPRETLDAIDPATIADAVAAGRGTLGGRRYRVVALAGEPVRPETVLVLTPARSILASTVEVVWPVVAVAAATLAVLVPLGVRTTGRLAGRITAVERHVARIADGAFGPGLGPGDTVAPDASIETHDAIDPPEADADEIGRLVAGVNHLSRQLGSLRGSLVAGERQRLLGQLAAGFAHELRNAITGARLAIDLHRRRCPLATASVAPGQPPADDSLAVAVRQLDILEEEVRGLLALGRGGQAAPARAPLEIDRLLSEVCDLTAARCGHAGVRLECGNKTGLSIVGRHESLRAALVNLLLNGIDAAGRGGTVAISATSDSGRLALSVEDTGAGPPESLRDTMLDPFVTGKPEGIGLGLAVARAVAEEHGGSLTWERRGDRTRFAILLPEAKI